ncbi:MULTISPECIES: ROK family protein [Acidobacteriaceae]|uniref:ROK family protein n=1 Tax=Acidobacteriaceae TaxID=204434 RepID=UPI00131BBA15|nr:MULTISPECIES: ROK family protein [Acidobacteriaceae]MDW5266304.1 ROK family protein [Edaphobacter sp.]
MAKSTVQKTATQVLKAAVRGRHVDLAYVELASSESARDINRDIVLELIRARQPVARADLSRLSGLQPSTVSAIVEQLLSERWITEGAVVRRPRGRRPTLLSLNDELVILVADLRPQQAIVAVVDLNGRFLAREVVPLVSDPERSVGKIIESMRGMRDRHANKTFEGIGISLPGRIHPETQRLILAPNLKWSDYDVKGAIEKGMKLQVELDNAANACLLSELWFGRMDGVRNAVLITVSEGLGTAILANGQIVVGRNGLAGEFGHIPIDPAGPACGCGQRGCWEVFASSSAALRYYKELSPKSRSLVIQELLQLAEEGDATAIEAVSRQAKHLGRGLRLITAGLSPDLILITGDLTTSWPRFGPIVQAGLDSTMLAGTAPRLMVTNDGELSRLRGGAAVVLQRHSGYHRSTH